MATTMVMSINCWSCGKEIRNILELKNIYSLGLALKGSCPKCNMIIPCNRLWKKTKTEKLIVDAVPLKLKRGRKKKSVL